MSLDQWIEDCCERGSGWIGTAELYASWKAWTKRHKVYTGGVVVFSRNLASRPGWVKRRNPAQTRHGYAGWQLKVPWAK
jgi:phage/plasmid-associated DNA primase